MSAVTYPSSLFPARPTFTVDAADGWVPQIIEGTEFALARVTDDPAFVPTLTVRIHRIPGSAATADIASGFFESIATLPDAVVLRQVDCEVLGAPAARLEATFTSPDGIPLFQVIHLVAIDHGSWTDIMSFIICVPVAQVEELSVDIIEMFDSIRPD